MTCVVGRQCRRWSVAGVALAALLASCASGECVDTSPPSVSLSFALRGTFDGAAVAFVVNDVLRSGDDEPTENLGTLDLDNAVSGDVEVLVAIGDAGVAVLDLRGAADDRTPSAIEPGSIGLSFTGEHGCVATSGTITVEGMGFHFLDGSFDVDMDGRPATGEFRLDENADEGGCV